MIPDELVYGEWVRARCVECEKTNFTRLLDVSEYRCVDCYLALRAAEREHQLPGLNTLGRNALLRAGMHDPVRLAAMSDRDILGIPFVGRASLAQIRRASAVNNGSASD